MNWIDADRAAEARQRREDLLARPGVRLSCLGTKIHHGPLSPGCRQCADKAWSCLFISGRCNGRCFYCPTPQNNDDPPMSGTVPFRRAGDFAAFVRLFGFGGASVSGGEPFLDFERSLEYVRALRATCGPGLHIWLYTNGILATAEKIGRLALAGLDEIRFDIGATDYSLDAARLARGVVPTVTVEIPAVPEELQRLRALLPKMWEAGVSHLNLHQLRLTPHNARHLLERDYTFVHGPKVTVLESELCALELVAHAAALELPLAVNYCSFVYKNRFQAAAARERFGSWLLENGEELTASGHIRTVETQDSPHSPWRATPLSAVAAADAALRVGYDAAFLRPAAAPGHVHRSVPVTEGFDVVLERHCVQEPRPITLDGLRHKRQAPVADPALPGLYPPRLDASFEWLPPGLGVYF
ncbi:Radical SAM superfamily protein [anaerobic digester metagenome]